MNHNDDRNKEFKESDWKLFRKRIATWQENYMDRLNKEYIAILSQDKSPSEKFWELNERMKKDKEKPGVLIELKRSAMVLNILMLLRDEAIEMDDLNDFSDRLKETIQEYQRAWS